MASKGVKDGGEVSSRWWMFKKTTSLPNLITHKIRDYTQSKLKLNLCDAERMLSVGSSHANADPQFRSQELFPSSHTLGSSASIIICYGLVKRKFIHYHS